MVNVLHFLIFSFVQAPLLNVDFIIYGRVGLNLSITDKHVLLDIYIEVDKIEKKLV